MNSVVTIFERLGMVERIEDSMDGIAERVCRRNEAEIEKQDADIKMDDDIKINKLLNVQEIYKKAGLTGELTSTVFIIDSFAKALPESLPTSVKRQSVLNLISTSSMDIQNILKDGKKRLQELSIYSQGFSSRTDEAISKNEIEIKKLVSKINDYKKQISDMKKLKQEQRAVVEYETQRIEGIIQFIEDNQ